MIPPVTEFTRVFYHGTKPKYHGRATITARELEWSITPNSSDGFRYTLRTPAGNLYAVRRQSFHTMREVNNA